MFTPSKFIIGTGWVVNSDHLFIKPPDKGKKRLQRDLFHQHLSIKIWNCQLSVVLGSFLGVLGGFFCASIAAAPLRVTSSLSRNKTKVQGAVDGRCDILLMTDCVIAGTAQIFFNLSFFPHVIPKS